jgi:hypothetical protein
MDTFLVSVVAVSFCVLLFFTIKTQSRCWELEQILLSVRREEASDLRRLFIKRLEAFENDDPAAGWKDEALEWRKMHQDFLAKVMNQLSVAKREWPD